jgi:GNAT superfamily N-acetyltransferase
MLKFRKLKESDLAETDWEQAALTALLPSPSYWEDAVSAGAAVIVIFDGETPVGMLEMDAKPTESRPACAKVNRVLILPELRRHGLGRMLMALAAGEAVSRQLWFIAGAVPETEEAQGFAAGIHLRKSEWFDDLFVLDLSDVEGLRHG